MNTRLRVLLVGRGRMGQLVESLAPEYDIEIAGSITRRNAGDPAAWATADVAIDFSVADAVPVNARALASRGLSLVIGTTGWHDQAEALRRDLTAMEAGVIAAPNFAIGVNAFVAMAEQAACLLADRGLPHGFTKRITPRRRMRHPAPPEPCRASSKRQV